MKSTALIMSDWSINRMLVGEMTQTSRIRGLEAVNAEPDKWNFDMMEINPLPLDSHSVAPKGFFAVFGEKESQLGALADGWVFVKCPWRVGDEIWVKGAWRIGGFCQNGNLYKIEIIYKADGAYRWVYVSPEIFESLKMAYKNSQWRSPLLMPRLAARPELFRTITGIEVQRVQDISEEDAKAEGVILGSSAMGHVFTGREHYRALWNSLHAKPKSVRRNSKWGRMLGYGQRETNETFEEWNADKRQIATYISFPFAEEDGDHRDEIQGKPHFRCVNPWVWLLKFRKEY